MKSKLLYTVLTAALFLLYQCEEVKDWHDPTDNIPPGIVTNVKVENTYGGAKITYTLPSDNDLLGLRRFTHWMKRVWS